MDKWSNLQSLEKLCESADKINTMVKITRPIWSQVRTTAFNNGVKVHTIVEAALQDFFKNFLDGETSKKKK